MGEVKKPKTAGNKTEMQDGWQRWLKKEKGREGKQQQNSFLILF